MAAYLMKSMQPLYLKVNIQLTAKVKCYAIQ